MLPSKTAQPRYPQVNNPPARLFAQQIILRFGYNSNY